MTDDSRLRVPRVLQSPITLSDQGSFYAGGQVVDDGSGRTATVGHLYVSFQKPMRPRKYPLVMWHGGAQTGKTWESTPDGREGYNTIWLRRGYCVFIVDEPYVGRGGRPPVETTRPLRYSDQRDFQVYRYGAWLPGEGGQPVCHQESEAPRDAASLAQRRMQVSCNWATPGVPRPASPEGLVYEALPYPEAPDAGAELLEAVGPSVLVTHSHGGFLGWCVALRSEQVRGIISYEPVRFVFPEGERPSDLGVWGGKGPRAGEEVPLDRFRMLTRSPIQIVYGDYLDTTRAGGSQWTDALRGAAAFAEAVNRHGGDAEVLCLPSVGIRGNSHFMFSDLNNQTIADLMADWLARKGLDAYDEDVQQCR